jgi:hypothetical protein
MKNKLGLIKRLGILVVLMFCLGFVMFAPSGTQSALARPCCSDCAINPEDPQGQWPEQYCADQCGASSGSCYTSCVNSIYNCWHWCQFGC